MDNLFNKAILRTPKSRYTGLKYLSKIIPKSRNEEDEEYEDDDYDEYDDEDEDYESEEEVSETKSNHPVRTMENRQNLESSERIIFDRSNIDENSNSIIAKHIPVENAEIEETLELQNDTLENLNDNQAKMKLKKEIEEINEKLSEDQKFFPNKSTLVINAILACLEDENSNVQKAVLEFMYTHLKLNKKLFTKGDKLILVEAVLYLLIKKENAHDRRVYDWLFGKPNLDNKYEVENNNFVFDLIMDAISRIFKTATANQNAIPLKILQKLFIMNEVIVESTLKKLSLKILNYMFKYHEGYSFSTEFVQQCSKFFENIRSHFPLILKSFFLPLENALNNKKDSKCVKIIRLIQFTFNEFFIKKEVNYFHILEACEYMIMNILKVFSHINNENNILYYKFVTPAIELCLNLNAYLEQVLQNNKRLKNEKEEDELSEKEKELKEELKQQFENSSEKNAEILEGYSQVYGVIVSQLKKKIEKKNESDFFVELFSLASKILVKAQNFLRIYKLSKLPDWFYLIVECLNLNHQHICIIAIETIIDILNFSNDDSPENFFLELKNLIEKDSVKRRESHEFDYIKGIIEKLWTFLDYNAYQIKIVELILNFQKFFQEIFKEVTFDSLMISSIFDKEFAIRRFASYWKLTNENEFIKDVKPINEALFVMLDYLDHDNPLIRHTSKSWLMDSMDKLYRIIDPIYETLIEGDPLEIKDPKIITEMFRRFKSILTNSNDEALIYISKKNISESLQTLVCKKEENDYLKPHYIYIDLLAILCLKFIEGPEIKKSDIESSSVNASGCEFLESIINSLEPKLTSQRICTKIIEPLLEVLGNAIKNQNLIMQVQVLNILKVIFFHSG